MWTLEESLSVITKFEEHLSTIGYHVALGGGVLTRGFSDKDLDIFLYPHKTSNTKSVDFILQFLIEKFQLKIEERRDHTHQKDNKIVYKTYLNKKRVDMFFL